MEERGLAFETTLVFWKGDAPEGNRKRKADRRSVGGRFTSMAVPFTAVVFVVCQTQLFPQEAEAEFVELIAWQVALEAEGFSPGLIDGLNGPKTDTALRAFQLREGLEPTGFRDSSTASILGVQPEQALSTYVIGEDDEKQVDDCPQDWGERSRRKRLLFPTLANLVAERFHTSERCLARLNPNRDLTGLATGGRLVVPAVRMREVTWKAHELRIDLKRKLIVVLDSKGNARSLLHCSVPRNVADSARGLCKVVTVVENPGYTFDPKSWPEVEGIHRKLSIPPGPRSPVGLRWIGLDLPGIGIHGTPEPHQIGKTGSHGCFRLTNWDAIFLASIVRVGTKVEIL